MDRTLENPGKRVPKVQSVMLISQAKGQRINLRKFSFYFYSFRVNRFCSGFFIYEIKMRRIYIIFL